MVLALAEPLAAQDAAEQVRGRLTNRVDDEPQPVEGVEIAVTTEAGEEVGSVTTDEDGRYQLDLPGPGRYTATLDPESLPDDVQLRDEERSTLTFRVGPNQAKPLLFPLGEDTRNVRGRFDELLQLIVDGVKYGLIIALASVGLSLIFGTTGLTNFAHGELVTWGALAAWFANVRMDMGLVPAAVLGVIAGGAAGALLDRGLWRPLRKRGTGLIAMMVVSIGLSLLLRYVFLYQFGGRSRPFADYTVQRAVDFGPVSITPKDLVAIGIAVAVLLLVAAFLQRTRMGKAMRAVADNPDLAASSGIDVQRVILVVWAFGGALAALGGILIGLGEQVNWQMGFTYLLLMFAGITLGGLGTAYGALVGGFIVGLFVQVSTFWISPELKNVGALAVLVVVLLVRPQGILGTRERIG
jgi:branched-chain amino acid transport system permease protein